MCMDRVSLEKDIPCWNQDHRRYIPIINTKQSEASVLDELVFLEKKSTHHPVPALGDKGNLKE